MRSIERSNVKRVIANSKRTASLSQYGYSGEGDMCSEFLDYLDKIIKKMRAANVPKLIAVRMIYKIVDEHVNLAFWGVESEEFQELIKDKNPEINPYVEYDENYDWTMNSIYDYIRDTDDPYYKELKQYV